jgi:PAS domain S-box-containing protein
MTPHERQLRKFPAVIAAIVALIAALVFVGWTLDIELLKSLLHPERIAMNPATATGFLLCALAIWMLRDEPAPAARGFAAQACGAILALMAGWRLVAYALDWTGGVDRVLFHAKLADNVMAPNTAATFLLVGLALLVLDGRTRKSYHPAQILVFAAGGVALFSLAGYLYRGASLYGMRGYIPMALNTAVEFSLVSIALLCARPTREPVRTFVSDTLGGTMARRLVTAAVFIPPLLGWLILQGERIDLFDSESGLALFVLANIILFNLIVWWCAHIVHASDVHRRLSQDVLRQNEERHRAVMEQAAEGIYLVDLDTKRIVDSNEAMERLLGYAHGELESRTVYELVDDAREGVDARLEKLRHATTPMHAERQYRCKDGSLVDVEVSATTIAYGGRQVACTVVHDISQRKRAEELLRASEARGRLIVETALDAFVAMDADGRITDWNAQAQETFGWSRQEVLGKLVAETIIPHRFRDAHANGLAKFLATGEGPVLGKRLELVGRHRAGLEFPIEITIVPARHGDSFQFFAFIHDITDRKKAAHDLEESVRAEREAMEKLRQTEEQNRVVVQQAADGITLVDAETLTVIEVNEAFARMVGYTPQELVGRPIAEFIVDTAAGVAARAHKTIDAPQPSIVQRQYRRRDGSVVDVEKNATVLTLKGRRVLCTIIHDVTERNRAARALQEQHRQLEEAHEQLKRAQSQLVQSEKLAGLGQMVAGVAHEINNPLSFVANNVAVFQRDAKALVRLIQLYERADEILKEHDGQLLSEIRELSEAVDLTYTTANLDEMLLRSRDGLRRIQQIVKDLRDFARLDESDLHEVDLNAGVESTINIIQGNAKKKRVTIEKRLTPLPLVSCHPAKVNQVVMNLISNAIDATPEGGRVTVATSPNGNHVKIEVSDTGPGVPDTIRQRIFDPFFTTKPPGEGTGLGLSISYGIVQDHGGTIELVSKPSEGAHFIVTLPRDSR